MIRMKTNIKPSDVYDLAIVAVAEKCTTDGMRKRADELADALAYLCDQRGTALYVELRDEDEAAKAKMEQESDHAEN